jgi:hypothetical protein
MPMTPAEKEQWLAGFIDNGWSMADADLAIKYIEMGVQPDRALQMADSYKGGQAPVDQGGAPNLTVMHEAQVGKPTAEPMVPQDVAAWQEYKRQHPVAGYAKERILEAPQNLKDVGVGFGKLVKEGVMGKHVDAEKLSAAKMLQDYLTHQDIMRAAEHQKDVMNRAAATPGILDFLRGMVPTQPSPQQNADTLLTNMGAMGPAKR